jgi:hypothetical protein
VTTGSDPQRRERAERTALGVFAVAVLAMAIVCGAIIVSGWFAGVIQDVYERFFWLGAGLAGLTIVVLAAAVWPGGADDLRAIRRVVLLTRAALVLLVLAPTLCIGALVADFFF